LKPENYKESKMRKFAIAIVAILLTQCTSNQVTSPTDQASSGNKKALTVFYQSNRRGEVEPCGCTILPNGGLDREANLIETAKKADRKYVFLDSGNLFRDPLAKTKLNEKQKMDRAKLVTEVLSEVGLDAFAPGPVDFQQFGLERLQTLSNQAKFPFIATNLTNLKGEQVFKPFYRLEKHGFVLGIVSAMPKDKIDSKVKVQDPVASIQKAIESLGKVDMLILLSQHKYKDTQALIKKLPRFHLVIGSDETLDTAEAYWFQGGETLYVDSTRLGQSTGMLDLELQLPITKFFSPTELEKNKQTLADAESKLKKNPKDEGTKKFIRDFKEASSLDLIPNASTYSNKLMQLDKDRFGEKNAITKKIEAYKASMRSSAIAE